MSAAELVRLICEPVTVMPGTIADTQRIAGYGLAALVADGVVVRVVIDGATAGNTHEWAVERAQFGDGDVTGADAFIAAKTATVRRVRREPSVVPTPRRQRAEPPGLFPVEVRRVEPARQQQPEQQPVSAVETEPSDEDILRRIHPALRAEITRQADGDLSRVVIESFTKVTILPAR